MVEYPVTAIFGPTLQGEGHFVGYPAVFVRLAGCSVHKCSIRPECDELPWKENFKASAREIVDVVGTKARGGIVVITGGEPTDHDLIPLIDELRSAGHRIHLETSGVRSVAGIPLEWLTVSPKTPDYVQRTGHTLKIVVRRRTGWSEIRDLDRDTSFFHRYLQPLTFGPDHTLGSNLKDVMALLLSKENEAGRWALSTQAHRAWGLP